jgi:hypothetical protein
MSEDWPTDGDRLIITFLYSTFERHLMLLLVRIFPTLILTELFDWDFLQHSSFPTGMHGDGYFKLAKATAPLCSSHFVPRHSDIQLYTTFYYYYDYYYYYYCYYFGSTVLCWALANFLSFLILYTVGTILGSARRKATNHSEDNTQSRNKHTRISAPLAGFDPRVQCLSRGRS